MYQHVSHTQKNVSLAFPDFNDSLMSGQFQKEENILCSAHCTKITVTSNQTVVSLCFTAEGWCAEPFQLIPYFLLSPSASLKNYEEKTPK